jgi:hypothetical protein
VTGGTGDFFGAAGEVTSTDKSKSPAETVTLYEADLVLAHKLATVGTDGRAPSCAAACGGAERGIRAEPRTATAVR